MRVDLEVPRLNEEAPRFQGELVVEIGAGKASDASDSGKGFGTSVTLAIG